MPGGKRFATRIAAAVSVLAPVYVIYVTTQLWSPTYTTYGQPSGTHSSGAAPDDESSRLYHFSQPQLTFEPPSAVNTEARVPALGSLRGFVTALVHTVAGHFDPVVPFFRTELEATAKATLYVCWHMVTVTLYVSALALLGLGLLQYSLPVGVLAAIGAYAGG